MFDSFLRIISGYDEADHDQPGSLYVMCGVVPSVVHSVVPSVCNN